MTCSPIRISLAATNTSCIWAESPVSASRRARACVMPYEATKPQPRASNKKTKDLPRMNRPQSDMRVARRNPMPSGRTPSRNEHWRPNPGHLMRTGKHGMDRRVAIIDTTRRIGYDRQTRGCCGRMSAFLTLSARTGSFSTVKPLETRLSARNPKSASSTQDGQGVSRAASPCTQNTQSTQWRLEFRKATASSTASARRPARPVDRDRGW